MIVEEWYLMEEVHAVFEMTLLEMFLVSIILHHLILIIEKLAF